MKRFNKDFNNIEFEPQMPHLWLILDIIRISHKNQNSHFLIHVIDWPSEGRTETEAATGGVL